MRTTLRTGSSLGFSLVELLITLTILSIGLVLILQAFSSSVKASAISRQLTEACFVAENKISELEFLRNHDQELALPGGTVHALSWDYQLQPLEEEAIQLLDFRVFGQRPKQEGVLEIATYLAEPRQ